MLHGLAGLPPRAIIAAQQAAGAGERRSGARDSAAETLDSPVDFGKYLSLCVRFVPSLVVMLFGAVGLVCLLYEALRTHDAQWRMEHRWDYPGDHYFAAGFCLTLLVFGGVGLRSALRRRPRDW